MKLSSITNIPTRTGFRYVVDKTIYGYSKACNIKLSSGKFVCPAVEAKLSDIIIGSTNYDYKASIHTNVKKYLGWFRRYYDNRNYNANTDLVGDMTAAPRVRYISAGSLEIVSADVDLDGVVEIPTMFVIDSNVAFALMDAETGNIKKYALNPGFSYYTHVQFFDINNDGYLEIIVIPADVSGLFVFDHNLNKIFEKSAESDKVACQDIDGDGEVEILVMSKSGITCFRSDGTEKWSNPNIITPGTIDYVDVVVHDVDKDGKHEIFCGYSNVSENLYHVLSIDPVDGSKINEVTFDGGAGPVSLMMSIYEGASPILSVLLPHGSKKVAYLDTGDLSEAWSVDLSIYAPYDDAKLLHGGSLISLSYGISKLTMIANNGDKLWEKSSVGRHSASGVVCDVDGDDELEFVTLLYPSKICAFDVYSGSEIWSIQLPQDADTILQAIADDIDYDGYLEIIMSVVNTAKTPPDQYTLIIDGE